MGIARACRDAGRKAKAQLEINLARDVENRKKQFFKYVKSKQKQGKYWPTNKQETWISHSIFTSTAGSTALGTKIQAAANPDPPVSVKEEWGWAITGAWSLWINGPWHCPGVLRELTDIIARPFWITFGEVEGEQGIFQRTGRIILSSSTSRIYRRKF